MIDRLLTGVPATVVARIGRTALGEVDIAIDDGALTVAVREAAGDRVIRVDLATIDVVSVDGNEVSLSLRGGIRLTLLSNAPTQLHDAILNHCRVLPELTSALRAFGSRRRRQGSRATATDEQRQFFGPLLDARRVARDAATAAAVIAAFDADALIAAIHGVLHRFAEQRFAQQGPARRALDAELFDATEPLDESLHRLRDASVDALADVDALLQWRDWARSLRSTFETADRVWLVLDAALDASPLPPTPAAGKRR